MFEVFYDESELINGLGAVQPELDDLVTEIFGSSDLDDGLEDGLFFVEEYPSPLVELGGYQPRVSERHQDFDAGNTHLNNPNTWALAFWLMTSGLSGNARDKFLKLQIVS